MPSRPDAPVDGDAGGHRGRRACAGGARRFVHGTTRVTNAIVEGRLPPVALVATAGFEDVLEIGRYRRARSLSARHSAQAAAAGAAGALLRACASGWIMPARCCRRWTRRSSSAWWPGWRDAACRSVAVCLLHAYANPAHERLVGERAARAWCRMSRCRTRSIPEAREYERTSSTAFNAAAMPIAADYLQELERRLPLGAGLQVFHSAGGDGRRSRRRSGGRSSWRCRARPPASPPRVASRASSGSPRVLTFDMGGTTTDVCLIVDGAAEMTDSRMLADRPLRQPMLAVHSIGAGGGSSCGWARRPDGRAGERRGRAGARLLRPRRHAAHHHRRQRRAGLSRPRDAARRPHRHRRRPAPSAPSRRSREALGWA